MRRLLLLIAILLPTLCWGLHVECVGIAVQQTQGQDTLFIFNGQPHLRSKVGAVDWYRVGTHELIQENSDETEMLNSGDGVLVEKDGQVLDVVYVFDYNDYKPVITQFDAELQCNQTLVTINGSIPTMTYTDTLAQSHSIAHKSAIRYSDLAWAGTEWSDTACVHTMDLRTGNVRLPAVYGYTSFALTWDTELREALLMAQDSVVTEIYDPIAVKPHIVAEATVRGTEKENEVDRPTDKNNITAISAPLEVFFQSNPTPAARFFAWKIYHSTDLIAERRDKDIRYTFNEPGTYRVVVKVSGDACSEETDPDNPVYGDSVTVTIQESQLRVPNVFTPNGDGKNDEFRVLYRSLREYHIWVYNRWGKLVYESTDPAKGWDGYIGNRPAAEGAYYYVIRAMGTDAPADASYHSRQNYEKTNRSEDPYIGIYQLSGDINLLR